MFYSRLISKLRFPVLLGLIISIGYSQNAYFESVRLNEAYQARDYRNFFQLLADQPDLKETFSLRKGQSVSYADLYAHFATTAFLKPSLDTMMKLKNREMENVTDSLGALQAEKTELFSALDNALQLEILDYLDRKDQLIELRDDFKNQNFTTADPYRQLKIAIEAAMFQEVIPDLDSLGNFSIRLGKEMEGDFQPNQTFSLPEAESPFFAQIRPVTLDFLNELIRDNNLAAQKLQLHKEQLALPFNKTVDRFGMAVASAPHRYLKIFPQREFKKMERDLTKLKASIDKLETRKIRREKEQAAGVVATRNLEVLTDVDGDMPQIYYTPNVIERPRLNTVVISGGSSFESDLLDATAGFIAERMKEELNVAFFEKFMTVLERPAVRTLFPTTQNLLARTESYNYSVLLEVIKEAFEKDLRELAFHAPELMRHYPYDVRHRQAAAYALISGQILTKSTRGEHPMEIIRFLGENPDTLLPPDFHQAFAFLNIVSNSLRDTVGESSTWVGKKALGALSKDASLRRFYLGLLYKEMLDFARDNQIVASGNTLAAFDDMNSFYTLVSDFGNQVNGMEAQLRYIKSRKNSPEGVRPGDLLSFYRSLLGLVNFSVTAYMGEPVDGIQTFTDVNNSLIDIYGAVANKNYSLALLGTMDLIRLGLDDRLSNEEPEILRYGAFMVALAKAENAAQIKSVIKAMALPVGSYGIKRRNYFNLSLNAYPGLTSGAELAFNTDSSRMAYNGGFTAPIGLSFSWGYRKRVDHPRWNKKPLVQLQNRTIDPNQRWEPLADTNIVRFSQINDSMGMRVQIDSIRFSQFTEVRVRKDTFNSNSDTFLGSSTDTLLLTPHPRWVKRQNHIRRASRFYTKRGTERYLSGSSGSVFVSFIDLGALVLFRLDEATEPLPEDVRFRQVFAPGVFYAHGFRDIPISILAGAQLSPQLRNFGGTPASALRFNLALTVDIPMLNFFTKTER
ncbi:MAG: hypothetical protein AB8F95_00670 [Bacteroidia bacterium]